MFGTVYRMKPRPGEVDAVVDLIKRWERERAPKVQGAIAGYAVRTAGGELLGVAIFQDEKTYRANANDPEQDRWYQELRSHLQADPEWNDGEISGWTTAG